MNNMSEKISSGEKSGMNTRREIFQQPLVWEKTYQTILSQKEEITDFFRRLPGDTDMILTGAGSSAFIGNAVFGARTHVHQKSSRIVPTTELITHPHYFLEKNRPIVLVSFARSGNSPESIAAVDVVNTYCTKAYNIIITCNEKGDLFKKTGSSGVLKILLPPETNDESLAMTSSFSSMMLAFILINRIETLENEKANVKRLSEWGKTILNDFDKPLEAIASMDFSRAVFLGSGPLRGTAEESHLKLQELTDGSVICAFNSFLGFRHGPRAVVNDATLLVYLFEDDNYSRKYEFDLVRQINSGNKGLAQISLSHKPVLIEGITFDLAVCFGKEGEDDCMIEYLCVAEVLVAQLLGFHKSISLGLDPDNPSRSGAISRVVEGVKIYKNDFKKKNG
jgi:tagatose-6-phosphate ketose/aldose isomerase